MRGGWGHPIIPTKHPMKIKKMYKVNKMSPFWQMICFVIITAILGGLSIVTGFIAQQKWSEWNKQSEPQIGLLSGRIIDDDLDYIIIFGAVTQKQIKGETLKKGIDLIDSSPMKIEGVTFPIKLYEENKSIMVDASVFDANNKTICQIVKNNWTVHPEGYQLNNSANALEIVDENLMPLLQLYFQEPNKIYIGGAFFDKNGKRWNFLLDGITDVDIQSQTLFKYPSSQYWGQLNENTPFLDLRKLSKEIQEHRDAIKKLSETELRKEVMSTVSQIREFLYNAAIDNAKLLNKQLQQNRLEENENEKNNLFKIHTQEGINRKRDFDTEYDSHFAAKSIAFKDELVLRLKKIHNIEIKSPIEYEIPGYYHKEIVADNLEYFAKMLNAHSLSAQQICDRAFTLVAELRKFNSHLKKEDDQVFLEEDRERKEAKTEEDKNIIWNKYRNQSSKRSAKANFDYNKEFKIDAIIIKQLLPTRPPKIDKHMEDSLFERPMIPMNLNEIASY